MNTSDFKPHMRVRRVMRGETEGRTMFVTKVGRQYIYARIVGGPPVQFLPDQLEILK